jgi:hypothetical protein
MKISAIGTDNYKPTKINNNYSSQKIPFGFGIDYGDDDYLIANDYQHKEGGNLFKYFASLCTFVYELIKENICDDYLNNAPTADDYGGGDYVETEKCDWEDIE